jgi:predicted ATPase
LEWSERGVIRFLKMQDFRGVRSGALDGLTPLVVLVGPNSSGKSTVLDALLIGGSVNPEVAVKRAGQRRHAINPKMAKRGADDPDYVSLFYKSSLFAEISVKTEEAARRVVIRKNGVGVELRVRTSGTPIFKDWDTSPEEFFQGPQANNPLPSVRDIGLVDSRDLSGARTLEEIYTGTSQRGLRREVKSFITEMLPEVEDLEILAPQNVPTLHLNFKDHALPIGLAGDGVQLLLRLVMAMTALPQTTVLLEEPETHMHPGAIRLVARAVHGAIARGVQVVLTTHSIELIDALTLGRPEVELQRASVYRLALDNGLLKSTRLDGPEVALARSSIEDDLR